jgi:hypothetical protein
LKGAERDIQKADTAGGVTGAIHRWRFLTCGFDDQSKPYWNILRNDEAPRDLALFEDREIPGEWLVEYFDDDGDYVTIFTGQEAEARARDYRDALKEGRIGTRIADAKVARSEQGGRVIRFPR